jgi:hypothetical protein
VALARHFPENAALPVATAGGLLASGAPLTAAVGVALARRLPRARLRSAPLDAAGTAAGLAAQRG